MFVHEKRPIRGIIFIVLSVIFGLIAGLLIKKSAQDASLIATLLYRFIFAVPLLLVFTILARGRLALKVSQKKILDNYNKIKRINQKKNLVIGFGITDKTISPLKAANGLVVGSMLCKTITNSLKMRQNPVTMLDKVVYNLKRKII